MIKYIYFLALYFLIFQSCYNKSPIPMGDTLEIALSDRYNEYCDILDKAWGWQNTQWHSISSPPQWRSLVCRFTAVCYSAKTRIVGKHDPIGSSISPKSSLLVRIAYRSSSRMKLFVDSFELAVFHLRVNLRSLNACMTKHLLNQSQIRSTTKKVCREGMSQCMRAYF